MDHILINTAEPYDVPLVEFFAARAKRFR
jgi:hypothetical protein